MDDWIEDEENMKRIVGWREELENNALTDKQIKALKAKINEQINRLNKMNKLETRQKMYKILRSLYNWFPPLIFPIDLKKLHEKHLD
ncbi:MAG: hypothetical protein ACKO96_00805 [Flammeovirgaceae bacterium]